MTSIPPVHVPQVMTTIVDDKVIDIKDEDVIVAPDPETVGFNNPNDFVGAAPDDYEEGFEEYYGDEDGADIPEGMEGGGAAEEEAEGGDITKGRHKIHKNLKKIVKTQRLPAKLPLTVTV